jgi:hypothetical protein
MRTPHSCALDFAGTRPPAVLRSTPAPDAPGARARIGIHALVSCTAHRVNRSPDRGRRDRYARDRDHARPGRARRGRTRSIVEPSRRVCHSNHRLHTVPHWMQVADPLPQQAPVRSDHERRGDADDAKQPPHPGRIARVDAHASTTRTRCGASSCCRVTRSTSSSSHEVHHVAQRFSGPAS